jgi:hypothetical protein
MDCGSYIGDAWAPIGYTAYEKSYMGWLDLKEVDANAQEVTLQSPLGSAEKSAYIIRNSNTECFIFENRQPGAWYPTDLGSGVMVTRIAYKYNDWQGNVLNNTQSKKRACMLTANGAKLDFSGTKENLYGYAKTSIASLKTLSGDKKAINIKNIVKNGDETITLTLGEGTSGGGDEKPDGPYLFYESFDQCSGTGANDDDWSSSVASSKIATDNEGWEYEAGYGGYQCARFGSSKKSGDVTTPAFTVTDDAVLTFKAAAWNKDGTSLILSAGSGSVLFDGEATKALKMVGSEWTTYTVKLSGSGTVQLTFTPAKRFFLDEVLVVDNTAAEIILGDANGDGKVDVEDVVAIVNKILGELPENFNEKAADVNGDGKIDVDDVVAVVNIILG